MVLEFIAAIVDLKYHCNDKVVSEKPKSRKNLKSKIMKTTLKLIMALQLVFTIVSCKKQSKDLITNSAENQTVSTSIEKVMLPSGNFESVSTSPIPNEYLSVIRENCAAEYGQLKKLNTTLGIYYAFSEITVQNNDFILSDGNCTINAAKCEFRTGFKPGYSTAWGPYYYIVYKDPAGSAYPLGTPKVLKIRFKYGNTIPYISGSPLFRFMYNTNTWTVVGNSTHPFIQWSILPSMPAFTKC